MIPNLDRTRALLVVFAMPGCGACDDYLPKFMKQVDAYRAQGAPFRVWSPGQPIRPGEIPVLFYDAAAENDELQEFADRLKVTATPTTCMLTRYGTTKIEGAVGDAEVSQILNAALRANQTL